MFDTTNKGPSFMLFKMIPNLPWLFHQGKGFISKHGVQVSIEEVQKGHHAVVIKSP